MDFKWIYLNFLIGLCWVSHAFPRHSLLDFPHEYQPIIDNRGDDQAYNTKCDPCIPGWGVKSLCNITTNTICGPCPSGTWSPKRPHYRQCMTCSKCGDGLYEDLKCTSTRDTKCDSCSNVKGHLNEDFKKKCDWKSAPDTLKGVDDKEDYEDPIVDTKDQHYPQDNDQDDPEMDLGPIKASDRIDSDDQEDEEDPKVDFESIKASDLIDSDEDIEDTTVHPDSLAKILALREKAKEAIKVLSEKLQKKQLADEDEWEDEEDIPEKDQQSEITRNTRPLPQKLPIRTGPAIKTEVMGSWEEDTVQKDKRIEVNYPPSYHQYPIDSLIHTQRRRGLILIALTCFTVITALLFIICYARMYRARRKEAYNRVTVVNLSPDDQEIIRQSANRLEKAEKPIKRFQFGTGQGYKPLVSTNSNSSISIRENPFDAYLDCEDERPREFKVIDEVHVDAKGHF